jgi:glycosyltransferase involved in cell wall biosynthesis
VGACGRSPAKFLGQRDVVQWNVCGHVALAKGRRGVGTETNSTASEPGGAATPAVRVLVVTPRFPPDLGGVERHVWEVSRRAAQRGCDVTVLCTDRTGERVGCEIVDGVRVERVRAWPRRHDLYLAPGLWRAMSREMARAPFDVVHVQSYHTLVAPLAMAWARRRRVPFVLTFHGGGHSSRLRHGLRGVQRRVLGALVRRAAALVAIAQFEIEQYGAELRVPAERFVFVPNGVDPFPRVPAGEARDHTVIASIGRLERYKGHHRVIEALPLIVAGRPDARVWIVGTGPEEPRLRRQADRLGVGDRVEIRSVASDDPAGMGALLAATDVVVSLRDFESHPIVALEALAAGRPLVVADNSGLHELVEAGLARPVREPDDRGEVAAAVLDELADPTLQGPVTLPTWDECAAALVDLYRSIACAS